MDEIESLLWAEIVACSKSGDTRTMLELVAAFEDYQHEPQPGLQSLVLLQHRIDRIRCELTHHGLAL